MFEEGIQFQKKVEKYQKELKKEEARKRLLFYRNRFEESQKALEESVKKGISIEKIVLDLLEELGFNRDEYGTIYLADVIETLYYERKIFDENNEFFDFDNKKNNHYCFARESYECGLIKLLERIEESKQKSYLKDESYNKIVYGVVNDVIDQTDPFAKRLKYMKNIG